MTCSCGAEMNKRLLPKAQWKRHKCPRCDMVKYEELFK